jgi:transcriptional regulator with XRE-family HTH domain
MRGLSVREVEEHCELGKTAINDIENGKLPLTQENCKKICDGINKAYYKKVEEKRKNDLIEERKKERSLAKQKGETNDANKISSITPNS